MYFDVHINKCVYMCYCADRGSEKEERASVCFCISVYIFYICIRFHRSFKNIYMLYRTSVHIQSFLKFKKNISVNFFTNVQIYTFTRTHRRHLYNQFSKNDILFYSVYTCIYIYILNFRFLSFFNSGVFAFNESKKCK